jgi:hypothetical protein
MGTFSAKKSEREEEIRRRPLLAKIIGVSYSTVLVVLLIIGRQF